jgi:DNA-binding NtrC family response regulator
MAVADDEDMRKILRIALENPGPNVLVAHSVDQAFETYRQSPSHAVIAAIRLGMTDGHA